jgi:hypothetical protein
VAVQLSFVETREQRPVQGRFVLLDFSFPFPFHSSLLAAKPCGHSFLFLYIFFIPILFHRSTQTIERGRRLFCWSRPSISLLYFPSPPHSFGPTHLTMRHRISHLWIFLPFAWSLLVGLASAAPAPLSSSSDTLYRRQENGNPITQPVVTQTVQTINTFVLSL